MKGMANYAMKRVQAIMRALENYHQFRETDSLHRIRVELKKLKSLIMLKGYADKKFNAAEHYAPLRRIFRKAGKIRQPVVLMELMQVYGVEGISRVQLGEPQRLEAGFLANIATFMSQVERSGKKLKPRLKGIRKKDVNGYVKGLEEFIGATFVPRFNYRRLHAARKRMKQLVYLARFGDPVSKEARKYYSEMEKSIGVLHDKEILLEVLVGTRKGVATASRNLLRGQVSAERKAIADAARVFYRN
jgi:CHAD domain-containing protein